MVLAFEEDDAEAYRDSDSSQDSIVHTLPAKRPEGQNGSQRKRHNADTRHGYNSVLTPVSQDSVGSVTAKQNERWSWANGKFQHYKVQDLLKEQDDEPANVWIYFDGG
jgi:hypothetical protein